MARPKLGESETERLHLKITADEIEAIDDWRYANRVPSRSEAVRRLVQIALKFDRSADDLASHAKQLSEGMKLLAEHFMGGAIVDAAPDNRKVAESVGAALAMLRDVVVAKADLVHALHTVNAERTAIKDGRRQFDEAVMISNEIKTALDAKAHFDKQSR
ncbi:MAG: hypothetical protein M9955_20120 [Rhizobiaceae bacterium]|nr:hypothetical protein [Rhizobiaceae bacterium]